MKARTLGATILLLWGSIDGFLAQRIDGVFPSNELPHPYVLAVEWMDNGELLIATPGGIVRYDAEVVTPVLSLQDWKGWNRVTAASVWKGDTAVAQLQRDMNRLRRERFDYIQPEVGMEDTLIAFSIRTGKRIALEAPVPVSDASISFCNGGQLYTLVAVKGQGQTLFRYLGQAWEMCFAIPPHLAGSLVHASEENGAFLVLHTLLTETERVEIPERWLHIQGTTLREGTLESEGRAGLYFSQRNLFDFRSDGSLSWVRSEAGEFSEWVRFHLDGTTERGSLNVRGTPGQFSIYTHPITREHWMLQQDSVYVSPPDFQHIQSVPVPRTTARGGYGYSALCAAFPSGGLAWFGGYFGVVTANSEDARFHFLDGSAMRTPSHAALLPYGVSVRDIAQFGERIAVSFGYQGVWSFLSHDADGTFRYESDPLNSGFFAVDADESECLMLAGSEGVMRVTSDGNQTLSRFKELKDCWELVSPVPDHALAFSLDGPLWLDLQEGTASRPQVLDEQGLRVASVTESAYHCEPFEGAWWSSGTGGLVRWKLNADSTDIQGEVMCTGLGPFGRGAIHSFLPTPSGALWCATASDGLVKWSPEEGVLERQLMAGDQIPIREHYSVLEDDRGFLWVSSNQGLICFDPETKAHRVFDRSDGLKVMEFNRTSGFEAIDGTLFFGTVDGLLYFHPLDFHPFEDRERGGLCLRSCNVTDGSTGETRDEWDVWRSGKKLVLAPKNSRLEVRMQWVDFSGRKIWYRYRLNGAKWITTSNPELTLMNLRSGHYELQIQADGGVGLWDEEGELHVEVEVEHAWTERPEVIGGLGLLTVGLVALGGLLRRRRLTLRALDLETKVAQRTLELRKLLVQKDIYLKEIHHRVKNNLQMMESLMDLEAKKLTDKAALRAFNASRGRMRSISLIHNRLYRDEDAESVVVFEFTEQLFQLVRRAAGRDYHSTQFQWKGASLSLDLNSTIPLGLILNELLTNTFKHNEDALSILVSMEFIDCGGGQFELSYRDSGRNFVAPKRTDAIESTGWRLIWRLCEQLNGGLSQREGTIYLTFLNEQARKSIA